MKNWKIIFAITLSALVLYNTLRVSIVYAYFNLDTKGFIEAFCENKDKPELACNGKCHLKKITNSSNNNENPPIQLIDLKDILLYNNVPLSYTFNKIKDFKKPYSSYLNLYTYHITNNCFHPPKG
ncbi:hypothetical protein MC378_05415 [Polaribacter sp. MSW13]|uniref:Uncharacterized protein n=1 Tax=Polaribacter marinus TaxID=2916838 RepID=A0A9X2AJ05_9FLAO|nr:hypothetical protein [Polaribacter marinus]MCI2228597.1 hypothetical protein [Polaribacter marinus]